VPTPFERLIAAVDRIRVIPTTLGYATRQVEVITLTWPGARRGEGLRSGVTIVVAGILSPRPKVQDAQLTRLNHSPGLVQRGDFLVDGISATYTEAFLSGSALAANEERRYRITRVANDSEVAVPEAVTGLCGLAWLWKRSDPLGFRLLLRPVDA
jgi:hypothetical protein